MKRWSRPNFAPAALRHAWPFKRLAWGARIGLGLLDSWRMDETYVRVKGQWRYLYRAVDSTGATLDFQIAN
jgi:DDE superfamily endonuclease